MFLALNSNLNSCWNIFYPRLIFHLFLERICFFLNYSYEISFQTLSFRPAYANSLVNLFNADNQNFQLQFSAYKIWFFLFSEKLCDLRGFLGCGSTPLGYERWCGGFWFLICTDMHPHFVVAGLLKRILIWSVVLGSWGSWFFKVCGSLYLSF